MFAVSNLLPNPGPNPNPNSDSNTDPFNPLRVGLFALAARDEDTDDDDAAIDAADAASGGVDVRGWFACMPLVVVV